MCFSASASFGATALLGLLGYQSLKKTTNKNQLPLYSIPIFFAIQQAIEGVLWLTVYNSYSYVNVLLMYGFLFFAFIFWPLWIPFSLYMQEKNIQRKKTLLFFIAIGLTCSLYFLYRLIYFDVSVTVDSNLSYILFMPKSYHIPINIWYGLSTVLPFFIATIPFGWLLGSLLLASYAITYKFYYCCLVSVWCFFVALLSALIVFIAHVQQKKEMS